MYGVCTQSIGSPLQSMTLSSAQHHSWPPSLQVQSHHKTAHADQHLYGLFYKISHSSFIISPIVLLPSDTTYGVRSELCQAVTSSSVSCTALFDFFLPPPRRKIPAMAFSWRFGVKNNEWADSESNFQPPNKPYCTEYGVGEAHKPNGLTTVRSTAHYLVGVGSCCEIPTGKYCTE